MAPGAGKGGEKAALRQFWIARTALHWWVEAAWSFGCQFLVTGTLNLPAWCRNFSIFHLLLPSNSNFPEIQCSYMLGCAHVRACVIFDLLSRIMCRKLSLPFIAHQILSFPDVSFLPFSLDFLPLSKRLPPLFPGTIFVSLGFCPWGMLMQIEEKEKEKGEKPQNQRLAFRQRQTDRQTAHIE